MKISFKLLVLPLSVILVVALIGVVFEKNTGKNHLLPASANTSNSNNPIMINPKVDSWGSAPSADKNGSSEQTNQKTSGITTVVNPVSPAPHSANLKQYIPNFTPTPPPNFDYGSPSPPLQVPPQPSCGANTDSSYYANCMDSYCQSYPQTSVCLNR